MILQTDSKAGFAQPALWQRLDQQELSLRKPTECQLVGRPNSIV
jgi:hypothetical protein